MVVGECAGLEHIPERKVAQFDFCAQAYVAREQTQQRRLSQRLQPANKLPDARTDLAFALPQNVIKPKNIPLKKSPEVLRCGRNLMISEKLAHQPGVRASGEFQFFEAIFRIELIRKHFGKSLYPCAPRMDQRAVDVE